MSPPKDVKHLQISLKDILLATNNFSQENLIARGGFGTVYRGESKQHGTVAVKRLDRNLGQGYREFVTEVTLLSKYRHENIVSLIGFCEEGGKKPERVLVYKFETNGSLDTQLRKKELTWIQCLRICLDAARGLQYLHDEVGSKQRIIHRDVKASNILLDENWKAKISDFGLSKMGPANQTYTFLISNLCGTPGYVDPECFRTYTFTQKSDVYSFGVVLFEVLCGKPAYIEKPGEQPLAELALDHYKKNTLEKIIDSNLRNQMAKDSFDRFSFIASQCLDGSREKRPFMSVVVEQLEKALNRQLVASRVQDNVTYSPMAIERSRWNASSSHLDPASSFSGSWKYDVFISFRGRTTFEDHLYSVLGQLGMYTYKNDDETLPRSESIDLAFLKPIQESKIAVVVFSENYADSSWCLDELAHIMKCREERGLIVIPIFYHIDPSDVRKQKGKFGKALAKHELSVNNKDKIESWKKALVDASNIAGWESMLIAKGHEGKGIKETVDSVSDKLSSVNSNVDENLVGMATRTRQLKALLQIGAYGVHKIGIWGPRGSGKTTLATSVYMEIRHQFEGHCIIDNIGEESSKYGLENLQEKLLSTIFNTKFEVPSVAEGKHMMKSRLCHIKVLILLDGVDDLDQLEALAGSHDWFGDGSRIIITTRYEFLLTCHKVDMISPVSLLSHDEAARLFNRYAYREDKPVEDYEMLSQKVVSYADGLPLALKVLGSFLYDKDKGDWKSVLAKLQDVPSFMITDINKITFYGLEPYQKELFLDIACFFRREEKMKALEILDACGYDLGVGVEVLIQKALITISDGEFDMDDMVRKMGHDIVRGEHPNNPNKHSRVWKTAEIDNMSSETTTENDRVEAIKYDGRSSRFSELISNMKKLRFLCVSNSKFREETIVFESPTFLSNELRYIHLSGYLASPLPEDFRPTKLVILKLDNSLHNELWKDFKCLPCLKELHLKNAHGFVTTPDFDGLPCLEKLTLQSCKSLEKIHPSLGNHRSLVYASIHQCDKLSMLPTIIQMEKLKILEIWYCEALLEFPEIQADMDSLEDLSLINVGIEVLPSSIGERCTNLISLKLERCEQLKRIEGNFHAIKHLQKFEFTGFTQLEKLPEDLFDEKCCLEELHLPRMRRPPVTFLPRFLKKLCLSCCSLKNGEIPSDICQLSNLQELDLSENSFSRLVFIISQLTRLKFLNLTACHSLVILPELPSSIAILIADDCKSLEVVKDIREDCKWLSQVSLRKVCMVTNGEKLLQSMLQGKATKNHSISLQLHGLEIPRTFDPALCKGTTCTLQLPENWYYDYCGFLMCAAVGENYNSGQHITMKHEKGSMTGMNSESAVWKESTAGGLATWVGYVSFGSLRDTEWWDSTSNTIWFSINFSYAVPYEDRCYDTGFGVRLVPKKSESGSTVEKTDSSELSDNEKDYSHKFKIKDDSKSALKIVF